MLTEEQIDFYIDHPVEFFEDILQKQPDELQKKILNEIPECINKGLSVAAKAGHGVGKTFIEAGIVIWWLATRPWPKVVCTAPTQNQLFNILWSELKKHHNDSLISELFEWRSTRYFLKEHQAEWFAVARSSRIPENMQGFHAESLLFLIDEASGVDERIFEVIEGSQTESESIIMMFGNPTRTTGEFYAAFNRPERRSLYKTFTMSCIDSPQVTGRYIDRIAQKYGLDSDIYRVRVLGEFPKEEPDTLIPLTLVDQAVNNENAVTEGSVVEIGVDVARYGTDETAIYSRVGMVCKQEKILATSSIPDVIGWAKKVRDDYGDKQAIFNIDDPGLGGGVTDGLQRMIELGDMKNVKYVNGFNGGKRSTDRKHFNNIGTETWFKLRDLLSDLCIPDDEDLIAQLSNRKYHFDGKGRMALEDKDNLKKRGLKSPDRADALILCCLSLMDSFDIKVSQEVGIDTEDDSSVTTKQQVTKYNQMSLKDKIAFKKRRK